MATMASVILLLGVLVIQISAMEINQFDNATNIAAIEENRRLIGAIIRAKCRKVLNRASSVLPTLTVSLTRLSNNRLYYFSPATPATTHATFDQARIFCRDHGMHLVTINSAAENSVVYANAIALGYTGVATSLGAWIGYRDTTGTSFYRWVQPGVGTTPTFFPAMPLVPAPGQCAMYSNLAAAPPAATSWTTAVCTVPRPFICEMEPPCSLVL